MIIDTRRFVEQFIDAHGNTQMAFLFSPSFIPQSIDISGNCVYEFEIVEKRKCKIPIVADCPEKAIDSFLEWYHSHTDGVERMLEDGTDIRKIFFPQTIIKEQDYPADDLAYILEMEEDHVIQDNC